MFWKLRDDLMANRREYFGDEAAQLAYLNLSWMYS